MYPTRIGYKIFLIFGISNIMFFDGIGIIGDYWKGASNRYKIGKYLKYAT